jgi:hypothetical protein
MTELGISHDAIRRLTMPVAFPDIPSHLAGIQDIAIEEVRAQLGEPNLTSGEEGLGPTDVWAFEYRCGLQVVYLFYQLTGNLTVSADSPEVRHTVRHMPFQPARIETIAADGLESELSRLIRMYPERTHEIKDLTAFQVWRIDDNGNVFAVDDFTSERDARCRVSQLEKSMHKQMYWYERRKL